MSNFVDSLVDYLRYGTKEKRTVQFREDATQTNTIGEIDDTGGDIRGRNDQSEGGRDREYLRPGRGVQNAETSRNGERLHNDNLVGRHYRSEEGRDRETEESDRRGKKGNDRENHGQAQEKLGQDVQADRHRRTVDVAEDGKLYRDSMFRDGGVLPTYEESLASSKAAGYTKKQHDAWWNRAHKNMRLRAEDIAKKLHLEGVVDIYETADDLNGVENKPMKLYGNKVIKKMKKHGFTLDELRDLPVAVANPIAVFNNYGKDGNRSILTELKTAQGNVLVAITLGEDADIDFNIVSSVFGKGKDNIVDWLNKGLATYINKEKGLRWLSSAKTNSQAIANEALSSAAKVVENFVDPKISAGNVEKMQKNYTEAVMARLVRWQETPMSVL